MVRSLLIRGMVAGLVAGLVAFVFAWVVGEPALEGGIAYEDAVTTASGDHDHTELVGRGVQSTIGLGVAFVVYGVALGGILALVHAAAQGRLGRLGPKGTAVVVALVGFVSAILVPFLKYPANPPASSVDETIGQRTGLYVLLVALSLVLAAAAAVTARRLAARLGWWNAIVAAGLGYLVVIGVVSALLPSVAETPAGFPAPVLYDFRIAALGGHAVLWTALALVYAELAHRVAGRSGAYAGV
jgi:predicted cobalt transporter CbtA